jgi:hypothetical protein
MSGPEQGGPTAPGHGSPPAATSSPPHPTAAAIASVHDAATAPA